jgi:hypothetical protein
MSFNENRSDYSSDLCFAYAQEADEAWILILKKQQIISFPFSSRPDLSHVTEHLIKSFLKIGTFRTVAA